MPEDQPRLIVVSHATILDAYLEALLEAMQATSAADQLALDLGTLRLAYGPAYRVSVLRGVWVAQRRDDSRVLRAPTSAHLLADLRTDYATRPVPREFHRDD